MRKRLFQLALMAVLALGVIGLSSDEARADTLIPNLTSIVDNGDGTWTWNYDVILTSGARIGPDKVSDFSDFFTVYDFFGYIPGTAMVTAGNGNWSPMVHLLGDTPLGVLPPDNAAISNLTFTYVGAAVIIGADATVMSFSADSVFGAPALGNYSSQDTKNVPGDPSDGTRAAGIGDVEVPIGRVPEPATLLLVGSVLLGMGLIRRSAS